MSSLRSLAGGGDGSGGPDSLTVPLAAGPHAPHGPAEVRLAGVDTKEKMYEPKQRKKLVRVFTVVAYLFFVSLAAVMLSLYYVFLWNPSPREERQRQQQLQQRQQQPQQQIMLQKQQFHHHHQQPQQQEQEKLVLQEDWSQDWNQDWSEDWSDGWSSTSAPEYVEATEILDEGAAAHSGPPSRSDGQHQRFQVDLGGGPTEQVVVFEEESGNGRLVSRSGPALRRHHQGTARAAPDTNGIPQPLHVQAAPTLRERIVQHADSDQKHLP